MTACQIEFLLAMNEFLKFSSCCAAVALALSLSSPAFAIDNAISSDWRSASKSGTESLSIGDYVSAERELRSALDKLQHNEAYKTNVSGIQNKYAESLLWQGKFAETAKEIKKAISIANSTSGPLSYDYARALELQSWLLQAQGKNDKSVETMRDALNVYQSKNADTPELADALEHMGVLKENLGVYDQAAECYTKALALRKKISGEHSVDAADLYEALARISQRKGRPDDAQRYFADAMRIKESRGEPWKRYAPEPTERVVLFRYFQGAPYCEQSSAGGMTIEKVTANGVTVEAGLLRKPSDFSKTTRAQVRISNDSQYDVDVLSQPPTFIQLTPTVNILKPINAQSLAAQIEKKGESKAKWIKFWGADAMTPVTTQAWTQGSMNYGYVPTPFGWSAGPNRGRGWNNNNYSNSSFATTMVPDYQAREEAYRKAREATERSKADAQAVLDASLGPNRLPPGAMIQGSLDFDFSKFQKAILRVPVGNAIYEFRFE